MTLVEPFDTFAAVIGWVILAIWHTFAHATYNVAHGLGPGWAFAWWLVVLAAGHAGRWGWVRVRAHKVPADGTPVAVLAIHQAQHRVATLAAVGGTGACVGLIAVAVLWEWSVVLVGAVALWRALRHRRRVALSTPI